VEERSGFLPDRIIHLHVTRLCNLACLHCYSESAPQQSAEVDLDALWPALTLLRAEGYRLISLSGGEPLVYRSIRELVEGAKALDFRVSMITNGLLATERMDPVLRLLDAVAISFDGLGPSHDRMRGRAGAFERASAAVHRLASTGRRVGAAISLTREAIPELPDLADHLVAQGATSLQIRPVARAGRARSLPDATFARANDSARIYLVVEALRQELPGVQVHCDLAPARGLWRQRGAYSALLGECEDGCPSERPLADLVNPLVVTESGMLKPIAYDFDPRFDVGSITSLSPGSVSHYKRHGVSRLQALVGSALAGLEHGTDFVDWFDHCARLSETTVARDVA
jgi:pyruvate-formate lyase-activating enzyme